MTTPSDKSEGMNELISNLMGKDRIATIESGGCMSCDTVGITEESFRDAISFKEYSISGMCQACQDSFWVEDEADPDEEHDYDPEEDRDDISDLSLERDEEEVEEDPFGECPDCGGAGEDEEGDLCEKCDGTGEVPIHE